MQACGIHICPVGKRALIHVVPAGNLRLDINELSGIEPARDIKARCLVRLVIGDLLRRPELDVVDPVPERLAEH